MKINSSAGNVGKRNVMPPNHFPCSGLHGCLGPVPTSVAAGDRLLGRSWKRELGLPASTPETSLGAAGLPSTSQQKLPVYGWSQDLRLHISLHLRTSPSLVKAFPKIPINETKLKRSLACVARFLLLPTQIVFFPPKLAAACFTIAEWGRATQYVLSAGGAGARPGQGQALGSASRFIVGFSYQPGANTKLKHCPLQENRMYPTSTPWLLSVSLSRQDLKCIESNSSCSNLVR